MTEAEWLNCDDPARLLDFLAVNHSDRAWGRRTHLFACGCLRRAWHLLPDGPFRQAALAVGRYADGQATEAEVEAAADAAEAAAETAAGPAWEAAARAVL